MSLRFGTLSGLILSALACARAEAPAGGGSEVAVANAASFAIPANQTLFYKGKDDAGNPCELTLRTDGNQSITNLLLSGTFKGRAFSTPSSMTAVPGGFEGVVDLFKVRSSSEFGLRPHVFKPGLTLAWSSPHLEVHTIEAKMYGEALASLTRFEYYDHGPFIWLGSTCQDLVKVVR